MATPKIVGTRENPMHVGGHFHLTRVSWPGGIFVVVIARAEYDVGAPGSRTGEVRITTAGGKIGGRILAQRNIHEPEKTVGSGRHPARSTFMAVLRFSRPLTTKDDAFSLKLTGSLKITDPITPVAGGAPFCGTSTATGIWSDIYALPTVGNPNVPSFFQDVTWTNSSPAGSDTVHYTNGPLAGLTIADVGHGHATHSGTSDSIWYQDTFGNFINTYRPCSELPAPGPIPPATKTEGWKLIRAYTFPTSHNKVGASAEWLPTMEGEEIVLPDTDKSFGGFMCRVKLSELIVGQNSDFLPIFDDLPQGDYGFRVTNVPFTQFVAQNPPQRKPDSVSIRWNLPCLFPTSPAFARYDMAIGTNKPPPYASHGIDPPADPNKPAPFSPDLSPPSNQSFLP